MIYLTRITPYTIFNIIEETPEGIRTSWDYFGMDEIGNNKPSYEHRWDLIKEGTDTIDEYLKHSREEHVIFQSESREEVENMINIDKLYTLMELER